MGEITPKNEGNVGNPMVGGGLFFYHPTFRLGKHDGTTRLQALFSAPVVPKKVETKNDESDEEDGPYPGCWGVGEVENGMFTNQFALDQCMYSKYINIPYLGNS